MTGWVRVHAEYEGDSRDEADVVVVGSGPCGAVVARELAEAGRSVVLLEEGPPFTPADFELDGALSMARTMREAGLRATRGHVMPTMQAIALGGGSLVNSAICVRPPPFVFEEWAGRFDLAHTSRAALDPHFEAVERFLGIAPTPDAVQGRRNLLFREGCEKLGYSVEAIPRNVRGCRGSGECFTGCRARAKQSMDISYVPAAIRAGARVYTSVRAERVLANGRRVDGVRARVVAPFTGRPGPALEVKAKAVVLSAGCMATPLLLLASGLGNRSGQVGRNLQFHPGLAVMGVFEERVDPQFGATQGMQSLHFLREGFKLETLWAPPAVLAVRLPGSGLALKERLAEIPHASIVDAIASCHRSLGEVRPKRRGSLEPQLRWRLDPADLPVLERALATIVDVLFAAGARKVLPGVHGLPEELGPGEVGLLRDREYHASDFVMGANHAFCTTRMHGDPAQGVVDDWGRCHDLENLYVADTGVFPRCTSVNPMLTGMALAHRTAQALHERL